MDTTNNIATDVSTAVNAIRTAILQSQERAVKAVNQEQLALYYGIGRYISTNTRKKNWGKGVIEGISNQLRSELPGLRGFSATNLKNMRLFYEAWCTIENNSSVATDEFGEDPANVMVLSTERIENKIDIIRQLQLTNLENFPLAEFLSISFSHHISIINNAKDIDERLFYIRYCHNYKPTTDALPRIIKQQSIVHNVKNFIMTFGKGFTFIGNQVHFDKLGHDHWIDLLFYNRDLHRTVVFELKKGNFKVAYLAQLSSYLRILNDDDRREGENPPVGIILCKNMDKEYVNYIMQDFLQPMGVATYKTADEVEPELVKFLPPKEELVKLLDSSEEEDK